MAHYSIEGLDGIVEADSPQQAEHYLKSLLAKCLATNIHTLGLPKYNRGAGWIQLHREDFARLLSKGFRVKERNGT